MTSEVMWLRDTTITPASEAMIQRNNLVFLPCIGFSPDIDKARYAEREKGAATTEYNFWTRHIYPFHTLIVLSVQLRREKYCSEHLGTPYM